MARAKTPPEIFDATLTISHLGRSGDGVAVHDDYNIFVPGVLAGEVVTAKVRKHPKFPATGKVVSIDKAAANRIAAACVHFGVCGGCALQHMDAASYQGFKLGLLQHELDRAGIKPETMLPMAVSPPCSRRRVVYSGRRLRDGQVSLGFNERGANWLVNVSECAVVKPEITATLVPLRALLLEILEHGDKVDVAITSFKSGLDVVLLGLQRLDLQGREALATFAAAHKVARLSVRARRVKDREPIYQSSKPTMQFGEVIVAPPAGSFLQATDEGEAAMVGAALDAIKRYAPNAKSFADLFCGSGTFTGPLASLGKVYAAEFEGESLNALTAARAPNVKTEARDLMAEPLTPTELNKFDVVLFDPPRAGAKTQSEELARSNVKLVIAVSCNPETFGRDAKALIDGGYVLREMMPVDQFLWTAHLELVGVFTKG